jgi:hypothetical protein
MINLTVQGLQLLPYRVCGMDVLLPCRQVQSALKRRPGLGQFTTGAENFTKLDPGWEIVLIDSYTLDERHSAKVQPPCRRLLHTQTIQEKHITRVVFQHRFNCINSIAHDNHCSVTTVQVLGSRNDNGNDNGNGNGNSTRTRTRNEK